MLCYRRIVEFRSCNCAKKDNAMIKNILVTTDLSEESKVAFPVAVELATAMDCRVDLLAIIEDPAQAAMLYAMDFPVAPVPDIQEQLKQQVEKEIAALASQYFESVTCHTHVRAAAGPIHTEILDFANDRDVDLIIIATHGRTGISRLLIGSITERVLRHAVCPVLTVPVSRKK
ncbi:MAG: universal stress protein [Candidatus Dadabacteria bacterium]|nr:MAG: universal stress protein [Candidatus Dadabacteria bacterium]